VEKVFKKYQLTIASKDKRKYDCMSFNHLIMPIIKYLDRLKRMDALIRRRATGSSEQFAGKIGLSRSALIRHLSDLKKLGGPVYYDPLRRSYCYEEEVCLEFGFRRISEKEMQKKTGGQALCGKWLQTSLAWGRWPHLGRSNGYKMNF